MFLWILWTAIAAVQSLSHVQLFATPWTAACQASRSFTVSWSLLKLMFIESMMPFTHLILCCPFSSYPQYFPESECFPISWLFTSHGWSIRASASVSVFSMNIQDCLPLGLTGWSPCSPRDSQEFSPTPQFKSITSLALSLLHGPTLTSVHDNWKNHSFENTYLCQKSNVTAF